MNVGIITPKDILGILVRLPIILLDPWDEWFWWTKLNKYETNAGDWEVEHDGGLLKSYERKRKNA